MKLLNSKDLLTLKEIREETGLSSDTIRFYEKEGIIIDVIRLENGHRRYRTQDLEWLKFVNCLKATGMPLKKIKLYRELMTEGDNTVCERGAILSNQREIILNEMEKLRESLSIIDYKIKYYRKVEEGITSSST